MSGAAGGGDAAPRELRLFASGAALAAAAELDLPAGPARHVMVRRLQPGDALSLFDGESGVEWPAEVLAITRRGVRVRLGAAARAAAAAELPIAVTLAFGMPANERVDTLVEKATELGAAALQPLASERTVLKLTGERAERKRAHWQAVAAAACEQCGRAKVPAVHGMRALDAWLYEQSNEGEGRAGAAVAQSRPHSFVLSTAPAAAPWAAAWQAARVSRGPPAPRVVLLSGPEGGLGTDEMRLARRAGFTAVSLGPRILRADTAPLAALAWLALDVSA
jgi:16S rRNA (uracil1498-N3)-methyltransferase